MDFLELDRQVLAGKAVSDEEVYTLTLPREIGGEDAVRLRYGTACLIVSGKALDFRN